MIDILERVNSPADLKVLLPSELEQLAAEHVYSRCEHGHVMPTVRQVPSYLPRPDTPRSVGTVVVGEHKQYLQTHAPSLL